MTNDSTAQSKKSIVLIGLMGAGKSSIGRRVAKKLVLPFWDSDGVIESKYNCSVSNFFSLHGEPKFRTVEETIIRQLLNGPKNVLATGGGAFMNEGVRNSIKRKGVSIWLKASLNVLLLRTRRRKGRPLLEVDKPEEVLQSLIDKRYPTYALADIIVETYDQPHHEIVNQIIDAYHKLIG